MNTEKLYDLIGIGIGPFNLGLAALSQSVPGLETLFIDQRPEFNWHPGLLLDNVRLQVPFYADLVTLADPCSPYSYMAWLKAGNRMFRFAIHENYFITRREYNDYCRWVASQLPNLIFGYACQAIHFDEEEKTYIINKVLKAKNIVIGIGTEPGVPQFVKPHPSIIHSSAYLFHKEEILRKKNVTVVGSGQSAAEIFYDLLQHEQQLTGGIHWFTRASRFFPMEYAKLTLEMTSPDYISYFHSLDAAVKDKVLSGQDMLYKGINFSLIDEIYDRLYLLSLDNRHRHIRMHTNARLEGVGHNKDKVQLRFLHTEKNQPFTHSTPAVILATGYKAVSPQFLEPIRHRVNYDHRQRYVVSRDYSVDNQRSIFVQNAEAHSHGFNAADLGMGPYRNATILNAVLRQEYYPMERNVTFQQFGPPSQHTA